MPRPHRRPRSEPGFRSGGTARSTIKRGLPAFLLTAIALGLAAAKSPAPFENNRSTDAIATAYESNELPPSPNFAIYEKNCLSCHSSRYVINLPNAPRKVWEASVKKMVDLYDAPIDEANQKLIVDYLMVVRGVPD